MIWVTALPQFHMGSEFRLKTSWVLTEEVKGGLEFSPLELVLKETDVLLTRINLKTDLGMKDLSLN